MTFTLNLGQYLMLCAGAISGLWWAMFAAPTARHPRRDRNH